MDGIRVEGRTAGTENRAGTEKGMRGKQPGERIWE
jgi:hypothetical protein